MSKKTQSIKSHKNGPSPAPGSTTSHKRKSKAKASHSDSHAAPSQHEAGASTLETNLRLGAMTRQPVTLISPSPWETQVDGHDLLAEMEDILRRHTVMTNHERLTVALWSINTHCHDLSAHSPYLALQSPVKRCGKTTVLGIVKAFALRPFGVTSVTGPSLFRLITEQSPTVLIDEFHLGIESNKVLRELMDAAHNKYASKVIRTIKDQVVEFNVFGPKVIAGIGRLPSTIDDRSIVIHLRRRLPGEVIETAPQNPEAFYRDTSRRIARWVADSIQRIAGASPQMPVGLNDRASDNWRPILAIADVIGADIGAKARAAAIALSVTSETESVDLSEILIHNIKTVLDELPETNVIPVQLLHRCLLRLDDGFWSEFDHGQSLTKTKLAVMLSPFGIKSASKRTGPNKVERCYHRKDFDDVIARYCPHEANNQKA